VLLTLLTATLSTKKRNKKRKLTSTSTQRQTTVLILILIVLVPSRNLKTIHMEAVSHSDLSGKRQLEIHSKNLPKPTQSLTKVEFRRETLSSILELDLKESINCVKNTLKNSSSHRIKISSTVYARPSTITCTINKTLLCITLATTRHNSRQTTSSKTITTTTTTLTKSDIQDQQSVLASTYFYL
jgi:hypothetical protein